ncbi:hypothetical protein LNTAR_02482 [Lentisphaera araneosa HTCC2155]|uniref:Inner membrane protein YqiJ N-terminal domain-containing protein n=1 Tax=Lentisphaera araneosa HTCC2155 TaxID=313628 RepID=A6DPA6_9BACT|nr:OB-fold-containig protein [Lentisphaera araneosa]EDM26638.1 hypothetical protein LNTAR_02482 [Lentisphaera araneosa HTCC2155]
MSEILDYAMRLHVFPFTVILVLMMLFWIFVILGAVDISLFDVDVDIDADADMDIDSNGGFLKGITEFFNLAEIPLMVVLSFFTLFGWCSLIYMDSIVNSSGSSLIGWGLWVPVILLSSFLSKYISKPFGKFFKILNDDKENQTVAVGSMCILLHDTGEKNGRGQIETQAAPIDILCYTDGEQLKKGEKALVLSWNKERRQYLVTKYS